ncbi:MAG: hypothetical protein JWP89_1487 [Schlesneria sp.]|nr:hypothetical protein [Schlesneria sp.]
MVSVGRPPQPLRSSSIIIGGEGRRLREGPQIHHNFRDLLDCSVQSRVRRVVLQRFLYRGNSSEFEFITILAAFSIHHPRNPSQFGVSIGELNNSIAAQKSDRTVRLWFQQARCPYRQACITRAAWFAVEVLT